MDLRSCGSLVRGWLYVALLALLHWCVGATAVVHGLYRRLVGYGGNAHSNSCRDRRPGELDADARQLSRLPGHLAVLVIELPVCWTSLARIVLWSGAYGVRLVSVYDHGGELRRHSRAQLLPLLQLAGCRLEQSADSGEHMWTVHDPRGRLVRLSMLSAGDGLATMVDATRRLCRQVERGSLSADAIDSRQFGDTLALGPDPELVVRLGAVPALLGYPPWQLRLSEILQASAARPLAYSEFQRLMYVYGGIQQRCGA